MSAVQLTLGPSSSRLVVVALACACLSGCAVLRPLSAPGPEKLLARSIEYHDPEGTWGSRRLSLEVHESRPDGTERTTRVTTDPTVPLFELDRREGDKHLEGRISPGECFWNMAAGNFTGEEVPNFSCVDLERTRDYYLYLWGLPMKLRDPGTRLESIQRVRVDGELRLRLRVTYDPAVGSDVWDFDFDPQTHALVEFRFFHDEAARDGERIELEGEVEAAGMRLPRTREWFTNLEGDYLGRDRLADIQ